MVTEAIDVVTDEITRAVDECSLATVEGLPAIKRAIVLAAGIQALRTALSDDVVQKLIMPLQSTSLGFRTDKDDKGGYPIAVVRDCAIEALLRGFQIVGNEMNIIAGRPYYTKEAFERRVPDVPGVSELELFPGVPQMKDGGALVPYRATWKLQGVRMEIVRDVVKRGDDGIVSDERIPVRVNSGMGADAILGKAKRKILAQVFDRITGSRFSESDADAIETTGETVRERRATPAPAPPSEDGRRISMKGSKPKDDAPEPGSAG